jgi:hypothetical protein
VSERVLNQTEVRRWSAVRQFCSAFQHGSEDTPTAHPALGIHTFSHCHIPSRVGRSAATARYAQQQSSKLG